MGQISAIITVRFDLFQRAALMLFFQAAVIVKTGGSSNWCKYVIVGSVEDPTDIFPIVAIYVSCSFG
jgi:hypothetical protein